MNAIRENIANICKEYDIEFVFNGDDSIDVNTSVRLFNPRLSKIPVQFNIIKKDFFIQSTCLENLENGPRVVCGALVCNYTGLTSLMGAPNRIYGLFNCETNNLTSLDHFPEKVGGWIYLKGNPFIEDDAFYAKILHILESDNYPKHNQADTLLSNTEGFDNWLMGKRRKDTIADIINS